MRGLRCSVLVSLIIALAWPLVAGAESTLETVKKRGKLVAGVRTTNPPYGYIDEKGQNVGFDVDIVRALAQKLGVGLELKEVTAQTRIPVLLNGGVDLAAAAVNHYIERDQVVDFTIPYLMVDVDGLFVVKKGGPLHGVKGFEDLGGKTLAIAQGAGAGQRFVKLQPTGKVLEFQDWPAAVQARRAAQAHRHHRPRERLQVARLAQRGPDRDVGGLHVPSALPPDLRSRPRPTLRHARLACGLPAQEM